MKFKFEGSIAEFRALVGVVPANPVAELTPVPAIVSAAEEFTPATAEPTSIARKPGRPRKNAVPVEEPVPVAEPTPPPPAEEFVLAAPAAPVESTVVSEVKPTKDDVVAAVEALIKKKGIPAARALVGTFGVSALPDVPSAQWATLIKKAMEAGA